MKLGFSRGVFLLLVFLGVFSSLTGKAQEWEYGVALGTSGYMGEYNQDKIYKFNSFSGSIGAKYNFNPTWGVKGEFSVLGIKGDANYDFEPGLPFISEKEAFNSKTIIEFSVLPEYNFFKFDPSTKRAAYTPYVFAGIGVRLDSAPSKVKNRAVVPFGVGFKYNLKGDFSLDSRLAYRITTDRYLDDFSSPNRSGSFFDKVNMTDSYMTFQIGVTYTFFEQGCPTW